MKKTKLFLFLLALLPMVAQAQADQKLINKAQQGDTKAMVTLARCYQNGAGVAHDSTLAVKWFQRAADAGDGDAWLYLSQYYLRGTCGFAKDTARYFAIRKEWADKGLPNGMAALATAYEYGYGCKADTAKAVELCEQALKKGSDWAMHAVGINYLYGDLGYARDAKKALPLMEKAAKLGEWGMYSGIASYYFDQKDYKKAWKYLNEGMRWAHPDAWAWAAEAYGLGYGVEQDEAKAQHILDSLIAEHHDLTQSQWRAGVYYMYPDNKSLRDSAKAVRIWQEGDRIGSAACRFALAQLYLVQEQYEMEQSYLLKIANQNKANGYQDEACNELGVMYYYGQGCAEDHAQAETWWKRGADMFHGVRCANTLAMFYQMEEHRDIPQAVKYLRLADKYGDEDAIATLGQLYAVNGNMDQAMECYQQMIDKGQADGYYYLGIIYDNQGDAKTCNKLLAQGEKKGSKLAAAAMGTIYENGLDGTKVDYKKAVAYYEKSETAKGFYNAGRIYLNGNMGKKGVASEADIAKGLSLINQAADQVYIDAMYMMGYFYETGEYVDTVDHAKAVSYFRSLADNGIAAGQFKMGLYYELGDGGIEADSAKAIEYYQLAADQDYSDAKIYLGDFYRIGRYLPMDQQKAFSLYTEVHQAGDPKGTYSVGRSYLEGCGVAVDTLMAIPYLKDAAAQGIGNACYRVAEIYNHGLAGVAANADSAIHYYLLGHQANNGDCSYILGRELISEGETDMAFAFMTAAAQQGHIDGTVYYAYMLQQGVATEPDPKTAYRLFERVASQVDHAGAYYQLGMACLQGNGCPEDDNLGKAYLDTAANLGSLRAMYYLGQCYLNGIGCNADTLTAISWLEKAADNEDIDAINTLGGVYEARGEFKNAVLYYEKGIAMGSMASYSNLGHCYEEGLGVVLNSQKAYELYMYAAEHGSTRGMRQVANCYMQGIFVEENMAEALNWLTKAAEAGDVLAMYYCGSILEDGAEGVAANPKKAREWYKLAAKAGYEPAAIALSRMK